LSTSKAEFVTASHAGQEALYLRETLKDLVISSRMRFRSKRVIWPVAMRGNLVCRKFARRIKICCHFVRELVKAGFVKLIRWRTHKIVADALAKSLPSPATVAS